MLLNAKRSSEPPAVSEFSLRTELRCELSRRLPITVSTLDLGRYRLEALPTRYGFPQEAILVFEDRMTKGHSNAEEEGAIVLSFLALLFNCRVRQTGYRVDGLDIGAEHPKKSHLASLFEGPIEDRNYAAQVAKLQSLGEQMTKQFIRACNAYALAIVSADLDPSLPFLLLVTSLECISTQEEFCPNVELNKQSKSTERYCRLVREYCSHPSDLHSAGGGDAFVRDLKTVYYSHRSAFVHGGTEVSVASRAADRAGFHHIGHFVDGEEVFTPGLKWFFEVTRRTLLGFLNNFPGSVGAPKEEVLADIASARVMLTMRVGGQGKPGDEAQQVD